MKRHFKRAVALVITLVTMVSLLSFQVSAVGGSISFSDHSVAVGDTVTVTVSGTSDTEITAFMATLTYNTSLLEYISGSGDGSATINGGSGSVGISCSLPNGSSRVSFTLKFKAKAIGTATVDVSSYEAINLDEETVVLECGSSTVSIHSPGQASSEARLSSLKVGSGVLTPVFSPDVFDYSVEVPAGTEKLRVSLTTKDSGARYSISDPTLSVGDNTITISVTAGDGTVQTYTIHVTRPEGEAKPEEKPEEQVPEKDNRISVTVDGTTLYVAENLDGIAIPEGFELQTVQYGDREVPAAVGLVKPLTLFWLVDEAGTAGAFYVQDAASGEFYPYVNLTSGQKMFTIMPLEDGVMPPEGYEESTVAVGEDTYVCWRKSATPESEFVLIYAMNWDGVTGFYRYDTVEGTMQRCAEDNMMDGQYSEESFAQLENEMKEKLAANESALKQSELLVMILAVVAVVELIFIVAFMVAKRRGAVHNKGGYEGARTGSANNVKSEAEAEENDFE